MTDFFLDIETIPTTNEEVIAEIAANIKPPANYSKPETIAKWEAENKQKAVDNAVHATGLDGGLGSIVCAGYAVDGGKTAVITGSEPSILRTLFSVFSEVAQQHHRMGVANDSLIVVGHNVIGFDLRFIWQRSVILGVEPPPRFPFDRQSQMRGVFDTMLQWNPDRDKRTSLDKLCRMLGVPSPKENMDGSQVWDFFKAGRMNEIAAYCIADIEALRKCYYKMTFRGAK